MSKDMPEKFFPEWFNKATNDISTMHIRGAGMIARYAAETIQKLAESYRGNNLNEFKKILQQGSQKLIQTRPTAISLKNALRLVLQEAQGTTVSDYKHSIKNGAQKFIKNSLNAVDKIGVYGSKRVKPSTALLTHCNSAAALSVILQAHRDGKMIRVFATESRPWNQGYLSIKKLSENDVDVTLIVDSAVRYIIKDEDVKSVFVGADTVYSDGSVVNKIGTAQIALIAHEAHIPFYVCAETYKFFFESLTGKLVKIEERDPIEIVDPKKFPKVKFRNPVFDITPAKYIDALITEKGIIAPSAAYAIIKKVFKETKEWSL
jgi:ribose 1,5-bisphosphate isomerase